MWSPISRKAAASSPSPCAGRMAGPSPSTNRGDGVFGPLKHGKEDLKYRISFGDHETELYLERHEAHPMSGEPETLRWWVFAFDRKPKPRRE